MQSPRPLSAVSGSSLQAPSFPCLKFWDGEVNQKSRQAYDVENQRNAILPHINLKNISDN
jgi:hypothetical protein